jgi:hypothetical protein
MGTTTLVLALIGVGLARSGGAQLHALLPAMLREGPPPTQAQVDAAPKALFGQGVFASPSAVLSEEHSVLLENLAFCCSYGKTNCITNELYSGELSLGKICKTVGAKLAEGTLRC